MEIQTNTDKSIEGNEALTSHVDTVARETLSRFSHQITRLVVHLGRGKDAKSTTGDHRCMMEARIHGHPPIVAHDHEPNLHQAIHGAAEKLKRAIDSTVGRMSAGAKGGDRIVDGLITDPDDAQGAA